MNIIDFDKYFVARNGPKPRYNSKRTKGLDMWFRKRPNSRYVAAQCGISAEFSALGDVIHEADMADVQKFLDVTDDCMGLLFRTDEIPHTD